MIPFHTVRIFVFLNRPRWSPLCTVERWHGPTLAGPSNFQNTLAQLTVPLLDYSLTYKYHLLLQRNAKVTFGLRLKCLNAQHVIGLMHSAMTNYTQTRQRVNIVQCKPRVMQN